MIKQIAKKGRYLTIIIVLSGLAMQWSGYINPKQAKITKIEVMVDSTDVDLFRVDNEHGEPLCYYREIDQYPCDDKVCYKMELKIYWDIWGNFLKIETEEGKDLTKIGHAAFSEKDYERLHKQLNNPKSGIQYYKLKDLTDEESEEEYYSLDAISGATIAAENITYESVKGAVKTCFTLWHIVNGETSEIIRQKTQELNDTDTLSVDFNQANSYQQTQILHKMLNTGHKPEINFLENAIQRLDTKNTGYTFCLLELMRRNEGIKNNQLAMLSEKITNTYSISEIAIYNYLLQMDYNRKPVRNYSLYE